MPLVQWYGLNLGLTSRVRAVSPSATAGASTSVGLIRVRNTATAATGTLADQAPLIRVRNITIAAVAGVASQSDLIRIRNLNAAGVGGLSAQSPLSDLHDIIAAAQGGTSSQSDLIRVRNIAALANGGAFSTAGFPVVLLVAPVGGMGLSGYADVDNGANAPSQFSGATSNRESLRGKPTRTRTLELRAHAGLTAAVRLTRSRVIVVEPIESIPVSIARYISGAAGFRSDSRFQLIRQRAVSCTARGGGDSFVGLICDRGLIARASRVSRIQRKLLGSAA